MSDDEKIAEIKARHKAGPLGQMPREDRMSNFLRWQWLLGEVDRRGAEIEKQRAENAELQRSFDDGYSMLEATQQANDKLRADNELLREEVARLRAENERLRAERDALRDAAREYLATLGGAIKAGKFQMSGSAEMAHFVRQAMQKLDSLVFDREGPRPAGLEKLHEPLKRPS